MTLEELLKQNQPTGQGGASQYLMPYNPMPFNYGVGQYLQNGLLGPALNFSAPNAIMPSYSTNTYQPTPWEGPSEMYKIGSLLSSGSNPIFNAIGRDMMSKTPMGTYTITKG